MSRFTLLMLGLAAVLVLAFLCLTCHGNRIESRLLADGEDSLQQAGFEWAGLAADGCVLTLTGSPPEADAVERALDRLRALPGVCRIEDATTALPAVAPATAPAPTPAREPYRFAAIRADGTLRLEGSVPDESVRAALVDRAGALVGTDNVVDQLEIRAPAPAGEWGEAAMSLLGTLGGLTEGRGSLVDRRLEVSGIAASGADAQAARAMLAEGLPDGYEGDSRITGLDETGEVDAATCQRLLVTLMRDSEIRFATASAAIEPSSHALLDRLAAAAARCPTARIEISGHTDSRGAETYNLDLSQRRAEAVRGYLAGKGVSPERLSAEGYGETRPIADNSTAEGRARNRRIEFEIQ